MPLLLFIHSPKNISLQLLRTLRTRVWVLLCCWLSWKVVSVLIHKWREHFSLLQHVRMMTLKCPRSENKVEGEILQQTSLFPLDTGEQKRSRAAQPASCKSWKTPVLSVRFRTFSAWFPQSAVIRRATSSTCIYSGQWILMHTSHLVIFSSIFRWLSRFTDLSSS